MELIKETLNKTGYTKALELEGTAEAESRIENLEEFLTVAIEFEEQEADDIDGMEETEDSVTLMTLHSAKGLEFPVVFLVGMEEGIFPGYKSIGEQKELEEYPKWLEEKESKQEQDFINNEEEIES